MFSELTACRRTHGQEVGRCGEFTLDGRASTGGAARGLSAYWHVSGQAGTSAAAILAVQTALAPYNGALLATVNATVLEVGTKFKIWLSVQNFLGETDVTSISAVRR